MISWATFLLSEAIEFYEELLDVYKYGGHFFELLINLPRAVLKVVLGFSFSPGKYF